MNNTTPTSEGSTNYELHFSLAMTCLTFLLNAYQIYNEHNHFLTCKSEGCCKFELAVVDSE